MIDCIASEMVEFFQSSGEICKVSSCSNYPFPFAQINIRLYVIYLYISDGYLVVQFVYYDGYIRFFRFSLASLDVADVCKCIMDDIGVQAS